MWERRSGREGVGGKEWEGRCGREGVGGKEWEGRCGREGVGGKVWEGRKRNKEGEKDGKTCVYHTGTRKRSKKSSIASKTLTAARLYTHRYSILSHVLLAKLYTFP